MTKKRFVILRKQMRDFCGKDPKGKVIGVKGGVILVEAEVPNEDMVSRNPMAIENLINDPGEC